MRWGRAAGVLVSVVLSSGALWLGMAGCSSSNDAGFGDGTSGPGSPGAPSSHPTGDGGTTQPGTAPDGGPLPGKDGGTTPTPGHDSGVGPPCTTNTGPISGTVGS